MKTKTSSAISSETTALTEQSTSSSGEQPKVSRERDHHSSASGSEFEAEDAGEVLIASSTPQSTARAGTNFLAFDSDDDDNDDTFVKDQSESKGKPANTQADIVSCNTTGEPNAEKKQCDDDGRPRKRRRTSRVPDSARDVDIQFLEVIKSMHADFRKEESEGPRQPSCGQGVSGGDDAFARMVSETLARLQPQHKALAQMRIHDILYRAEFQPELLMQSSLSSQLGPSEKENTQPNHMH